MATEAILKVAIARDGTRALIPTDPDGEETLAKYDRGAVVKVAITQRGRNIQRLRLFFALMNEIYPHQDIYPTVNALRKAVLVSIGFFHTFRLPDGREILEADSISFSKMEEHEFIEVLERTLKLIYERILPHKDEELMKRINEICEGR